MPQWARDSLTKANSQAASQRTQLTQVQQQQQAMLDAVKSALGLGDKTPTPEELTKALSEERGRSRQAMVDLAVYQNAGKHAADPTALLDSRSFAQAVASIDQNAPDFATQLDAAIKVAVEHNPKLKAAAAQAAAASGTDGTGGTGTEGDSGSGDTSVAAFRKPIRRRAGLTD